MTAADRINRLVPYVTRLLEDDDVQDQLGTVMTSLRRGSGRARKRGLRRAASDRRVAGELGKAAAAAGQVARTLREPQRRRGRAGRMALVTAVAGAAIAYRIVASGGSASRHA